MKHILQGLPSQQDGTHLIGYVKVSYLDLVAQLGEPTEIGGDKTRATWVLVAGTTVATIYDYKRDCPLTGKVAEWHVGGRDAKAMEVVMMALGPVPFRMGC